MKRAAGDAIIAGGGTITHHHAVGRDHRPWYDRQRPDVFAAALRARRPPSTRRACSTPACCSAEAASLGLRSSWSSRSRELRGHGRARRDGAAGLVLAIGLPVAAALVWGAFIAPKASRRLADPGRLASRSCSSSPAAGLARRACRSRRALGAGFGVSTGLLLALGQRGDGRT